MSKERFIPLENQVLIEVEETHERTEGGILLPDSAKDTAKMAASRGTVINIGSTAFPNEANPEEMIGKKVLFIQYNGFTCQREPVELRVCSDSDILSIIEEV